MDIFDYIKKDHRKVAKLFDLFESASTERNQLEIIALIKKELLIHAKSEQATFYMVLEKNLNTASDIKHAEIEHEKIEEKLKALSSIDKVNAAVIKEMVILKDLVEHHVSEEEGKIFKEAKKFLTKEEAVILKEKMHDSKEKLINSVSFTKKELV